MGRRPSAGIAAVTLCLVFGSLAACVSADEPDAPHYSPAPGALAAAPAMDVDDRTVELWSRTVTPYLLDDLWTDRDIYDAGHVLIAPIEAAFRADVPEWRAEVSAHFDRFTQTELSKGPVSDDLLGRLHYLYAATRFMRLAAQTGHAESIPARLDGLILDQLERSWLTESAWQWDAPSFHGMRERVMWKLDNRQTDYRHYRAIIDEELFLFAIAAEYRAYERSTTPFAGWSPEVTDILDIAHRVIESESTFPGDGWLFQVGVWSDHPDFAYAGQLEVTEDMSPAPIADVAVDSSHSTRWAMFLISLRDAEAEGSERFQQYDRIETALANQFVEHVLVEPDAAHPFLRMNNYMDGRNGLFRWNYETQGEGSGYGPFELSGSLIELWWGLLDDQRVTAAYCDLSGRFPLSDKAVDVYVGPNTSRNRNPLVTWPEYFTNGFGELSVRLACSAEGAV